MYQKPISLGHKKNRKSFLIDQPTKIFDPSLITEDLGLDSMSKLDDELLSNKFEDSTLQNKTRNQSNLGGTMSDDSFDSKSQSSVRSNSKEKQSTFNI